MRVCVFVCVPLCVCVRLLATHTELKTHKYTHASTDNRQFHVHREEGEDARPGVIPLPHDKGSPEGRCNTWVIRAAVDVADKLQEHCCRSVAEHDWNNWNNNTNLFYTMSSLASLSSKIRQTDTNTQRLIATTCHLLSCCSWWVLAWGRCCQYDRLGCKVTRLIFMGDWIYFIGSEFTFYAIAIIINFLSV